MVGNMVENMVESMVENMVDSIVECMVVECIKEDVGNILVLSLNGCFGEFSLDEVGIGNVW